MIKEFIERFDAKRDTLRARFSEKHPDDYEDIVRAVVEVIADDDQYDGPDPQRIRKIDDGHYQGTLLFVIAAKGYQPSDYWCVKVNYGSCSGCDTLKAIREYADETPSKAQVDDYMTLALHVVQGIRSMSGDAT